MNSVVRRAVAALVAVVFIAGNVVSFSAVSASAQTEKRCSVPRGLEDLRVRHVAHLNQIRDKIRIKAVATNATLDQIAQDYACLLANTGTFDHTGPDGSTLASRATHGGYSYCLIAENLAIGQDSLHAAMDDWVDSPTHWANLQLRQVRETGLGVAFLPFRPKAETAPDAQVIRASFPQTSIRPDARERAGVYVWVQLVAKPC